MPRAEGRASTRKRYDVDEVLIATFALDWELASSRGPGLLKMPCSIEGCENRLGDIQAGPCGRLVHQTLKTMQGGAWMPKPCGWACPPCTERITSTPE